MIRDMFTKIAVASSENAAKLSESIEPLEEITDEEFILILTIGISFMIPFIIITTLMLIAFWKIFEKANINGWKSLIPIYGKWKMFQIAGIPGFLSIIPSLILGVTAVTSNIDIILLGMFFAFLISLILNVFLAFGLTRSFGKDDLFALGLLFIPVVFYPMLAFDKSEYKYFKKPKTDDGKIYTTNVIQDYNR